MKLRRAIRRVARFLNPRAGKGAQPEVQAAIHRWRTSVPEPIRARDSLWEWLLGPEGTPPMKQNPVDIVWAKTAVQGRQCNNCQRYYIHVATGTGLCDKVQGVWGPTWWCDRWAEPVPGAVYRAYQRGEVLNR